MNQRVAKRMRKIAQLTEMSASEYRQMKRSWSGQPRKRIADLDHSIKVAEATRKQNDKVNSEVRTDSEVQDGDSGEGKADS